MELREIRTFLTLAEELHFSRTAVRLRTAQSAVSYAIKNLETELGVQLFARANRKVALTPAGERFRERAKHALQTLEQAADAARRSGAGHSGRLVMRFTLMTALTMAPRALARFQLEHPDVELDVGPAGSAEQLEAIRAGRCDFGFMSYRNDMLPLATELVQRAPLIALLPTTHKRARAKKIRLSDLAPERFVFLKLATEPQVRSFFRQRCLDAGFEPHVVIEVEQLEMLLAMVAAGLGVSCLPGMVQSLRFPGVAMIPLTTVIPAGTSVVWDPRTLTPAGKNFLEILRSERARGA